IEEIFGYPDHLKFHSSMTLFARAAPDEAAFQSALQKFFGGRLDRLTLEQLRGGRRVAEGECDGGNRATSASATGRGIPRCARCIECPRSVTDAGGAVGGPARSCAADAQLPGVPQRVPSLREAGRRQARVLEHRYCVQPKRRLALLD